MQARSPTAAPGLCCLPIVACKCACLFPSRGLVEGSLLAAQHFAECCARLPAGTRSPTRFLSRISVQRGTAACFQGCHESTPVFHSRPPPPCLIPDARASPHSPAAQQAPPRPPVSCVGWLALVCRWRQRTTCCSCSRCRHGCAATSQSPAKSDLQMCRSGGRHPPRCAHGSQPAAAAGRPWCLVATAWQGTRCKQEGSWLGSGQPWCWPSEQRCQDPPLAPPLLPLQASKPAAMSLPSIGVSVSTPRGNDLTVQAAVFGSLAAWILIQVGVPAGLCPEMPAPHVAL
jgi:hypothetical protein